MECAEKQPAHWPDQEGRLCRYTGQRGEYRVYCRTASGPGADPPLGILFVHSGGTKCDHPGRYRCWKDIPGLFPGCGGQPELLRRSVSPAAGSSGRDRCSPEGWDLSGIYEAAEKGEAAHSGRVAAVPAEGGRSPGCTGAGGSSEQSGVHHLLLPV